MLKLEHSLQNDQIVISLKSRSTIFSPNMICAFTIALAVHLSACLLFTVRSFSSSDIALFPPVQVETDPNIHFGMSNLNTSKIDHHGLLTYSPEKPNYSIPSRPSIPKKKPAQYQALAKDVTLVEIPLRQIERSLYHTLDEHRLPKKAPVLLQVHFTGGLAARKLKRGCSEKIQTLLEHTPVPACAMILYHVKLEEQTGKLFQFVMTGTNPDQEMGAIAEKIIKSLRIEGEKEGVLAEGLVELFFSSEELDDSDSQMLFRINADNQKAMME